jgi:hypothetical protein
MIFEEEVNGQIIGGDFLTGQLFYDNRPQRHPFYGNTDEELVEKAKKIKADLIAENSGFPCYLYQDDSKFELRIY